MRVVFFLSFGHVSTRYGQNVGNTPKSATCQLLTALASFVRSVALLIWPKLVIVPHFLKSRVTHLDERFVLLYVLIYSFGQICEVT